MNAPLGDTPQTLTGLHVVDANGAKVGTVQQVYRDDATNEPEWITVRTGLFGMKESFVPLAGARRTGDELHVPHTKETIKKAPRIDADAHLDPSEETELYRYYGLIRPVGAEPAARPDTDVTGSQGAPETARGEPGGPDAVRPAVPPSGAEPGGPARTPAERNKLFDRPMAGAGAGDRTREARPDADTRRDTEQTPEATPPEERKRRGTEGPGTEGR
ncbi:PRC-barrel domain-containing protein [Streptomyces sp. NPDC048196]|uniref:PRC-barrel domain-containing protein n=1 Tax=Streptomyces sp. NPDC048196 TaxID=3154712 RepID=UPI0033D92975